MARKFLESEHLGVSYFRYDPGVKPPVGHRHKVQEEAYVIVNGGGLMRLDDGILEVKQWDVVRVAAQVKRAFEAGPEGLEVIAIGADRPPEGDGEILDAWWDD